jgi:hypothetical protein
VKSRASCSLLLLLAFHCGPFQAQGRPHDLSILNGNWHLIGSGSSSFPARITLTLGVEGDAIYAAGDFEFACEKSDFHAQTKGSFQLEGHVSPDGAFVLATSSSNASAIVRIAGTVPGGNEDRWAGNVSIDSRTCELEESDFVAHRLPLLDGIYEGMIQVKTSEPGKESAEQDLKIELELQQQPMAQKVCTCPSAPRARKIHYFPLYAAILPVGPANSDSKWLTSYSLTGRGSEIRGSTFLLRFHANSKSSFRSVGSFLDPREAPLQVSLHYSDSESGGHRTATGALRFLSPGQ